MASTLLSPSIIAKEALMQLENNLVAAKMVHRAYEGEFVDAKIGDTVTIRKPVKYGVRTGNVAQMQDPTEGNTTIQINTMRGVDLRFPTKDLTLFIDRFAERYLKHPMIALANQVDLDVLGMASSVWNWVGTPGTGMAGFSSLVRAPQRLDEMSVPQPRSAILVPSDYYAVASAFTGLYVSDVAKTAIEKAKLPPIAGLDVYQSPNLLSFTTGTMAGSPVIASGGGGATTYAAARVTNQSTITINGATALTTLNVGDVITIAGVYALNPVNKQPWPYLQQFAVQAAITLTGTNDQVVVSPAIIPLTAGVANLGVGNQYANVSAAPATNAVVTLKGSPGTSYPLNLAFHENAFALCMVPLELPDGATKKSRQSYKGLSIRVVCDYDIINDVNMWRLDILYGVKPIYPDLATRISG
jgi:hypothetical protein